MHNLLIMFLLFLSIHSIHAHEEYISGTTESGDIAIEETTNTIMQRNSIEEELRSTGPIRLPSPIVNPERAFLPQNPDALVCEQLLLHKTDAKMTEESTRAPQTPGTSFTAATFNDSFYFPPDSMGAVGPQQFIVTINGRFKSFSKTTGLFDGALNTTPENFFNSVRSGFGISDPRIRYDRHSQRWIILAINVPNNNNRVVIAVSAGSVITSSTVWRFFTIPAGSGCFYDYPTLGVDRHALYIGGNSFCSNNNEKVFVVRKSSVLSTGPIIYTTFNNLINLSTGEGLYVPQGVDNFDTTSTDGYFIGVDNASFGRLVLRRVSNPDTTPTLSSNIFITVPTTAFPIVVNHKGNTRGTSGRLDSIDDRLMCAHVRNGRLWTVHNIGVNNNGTSATNQRTRNGSRWYELNIVPATPTIVQVGTLFNNTTTNLTSDLSYWIPSIMTSGQGHMAIGCSVAGTNHYADAATAGRLATTATNQILAPISLTQTTFAYNPSGDPGSSEGRRWGDYSYVSLDPSDDMTMWTVQEFTKAQNIWGVQVIKLIAPPPATLNNAVPSSIAHGLPSINVTINGISTNGSGFFDPGAGFAQRLAATVTKGVLVNSVTYVNPTTITLNLNTVGATTGLANMTVTNPDQQSATKPNILTIT